MLIFMMLSESCRGLSTEYLAHFKAPQSCHLNFLHFFVTISVFSWDHFTVALFETHFTILLGKFITRISNLVVIKRKVIWTLTWGSELLVVVMQIFIFSWPFIYYKGFYFLPCFFKFYHFITFYLLYWFIHFRGCLTL